MQVAAPNLQSDRPASTAQKGKARTKRRSAAERWRRYRSVRLHLDLGREIRTNVYRRSCEVGPSPSMPFRKISRFFFFFYLRWQPSTMTTRPFPAMPRAKIRAYTTGRKICWSSVVITCSTSHGSSKSTPRSPEPEPEPEPVSFRS